MRRIRLQNVTVFDKQLRKGAMDRRTFLTGAAAATAANVWTQISDAQSQSVDLTPLFAEITKRHDEALTRLQHWIRHPAIAAENRGIQDGCDFTMQLLREAGFQQVAQVSTDGQPGIFATLDAGATKTLGLYWGHLTIRNVEHAKTSLTVKSGEYIELFGVRPRYV
jgi:hypothetical protein